MRRISRWILLLMLFCLGIAISGFPQNNPFLFRHITANDGLAGNDVRSIVQDNKGFMWFATNNGLQKYDGYSFTNYQHNPLDHQSISSDNLYSLILDKQNFIWSVSFILGFNRFDPLTNKSTQIGNFSQEGFSELFLGQKICVDKMGNAWLISSKSFACFEPEAGKLISFKNSLPGDFHPNFTDAQYDSKRNQLWIADEDNGICMYDLNNHKFYNRKNNPDHIALLERGWKPALLFLDNKSNFWLYSCEGHIVKYNLDSSKAVSYYLYDTLGKLLRTDRPPAQNEKQTLYLNGISEDSHGTIWMMAGLLGLIQYKSESDSFTLISHDQASPNGLHFNSIVHCAYEDREGDIWVGTDMGINVFNSAKQSFHFFESDPANKLSNSKIEPMDFLESDSAELWLASWGGGVTVFDTHLNPSRYFVHHNNDSFSLGEPNNLAWSLIKNKSGQIFIGCQHGWISEFDPKTKKLLNFHPNGLSNRTIMNMKLDQSGNIWTALYSGFGKWDARLGEAVSFSEFIPYKGVTSATASDIMPSESGDVWVGTLGLGLQKFDGSLNRLTEIYVPDENNMHSISSSLINCMVTINDSLLAIGTGTGGINIFNIRTKQFYAISVGDGLPSNNVTALYFNSPNSLWACAGNILCKVNLLNRHIVRFGPQDGMRNLDFSSCHHFYKMLDGRIFAGYTGGFLYFYPDSVSAGGPPAEVTLTNIKIFDHSVSLDSVLQNSNTLFLNYKQNFITLEFASLSYWESSRITYEYQLEGVDKNWVNANNQRFASYTNLQGGGYRFKVKCTNSDGVSSLKTTFLIINIDPPFWQTWWFQLGVAIVIAFILYVLYRYRINQLLQLQKVRNEISKDLHDDVGSTLSSISILSQVAKTKMQEGSAEQSSTIMSKINSYSQEMVEKMGDIVWAVNPGNDNIKQIIPRLKFFFIATCASKEIQLIFYSNAAIEKKILPMQATKNIYLICKEAINNAVKYSKCRKISVEFKMISQVMEISILDDGVGFDPLLTTKGNGVKNMQERANELKGTLTLASRKGQTAVILKMLIPIIR